MWSRLSSATTVVSVITILSKLPAGATEHLRYDSGWFCKDSDIGEGKCFRVVRTTADHISHRDCALNICPNLESGEGSSTLACISSQEEQSFLEEEIEKGGYLGDEIDAQCWIGGFWTSDSSDDDELHWVNDCGSTWQVQGDRLCDGDYCTLMARNTEDIADDEASYKWHADHCSSTKGDTRFCLCQADSAASTLYKSSIRELSDAGYDLSCIYFHDPKEVILYVLLIISTLIIAILATFFTPSKDETRENTTEHELASDGEALSHAEERIRAQKRQSFVLSNEETEQQLLQFEKQRKEERQRRYKAVSFLAIRIMVTGCFWMMVLLFVKNFLRRDSQDDPWLSLIAEPLSCLIIAIGATLLTICPIEDMDLDKILLNAPKCRAIASLSFSLGAILVALTRPSDWRGDGREFVILSVVPSMWLASGIWLQELQVSPSPISPRKSITRSNSLQSTTISPRNLITRSNSIQSSRKSGGLLQGKLSRPRPTTLVILALGSFFFPWSLAHLTTAFASYFSEDDNTYQSQLWRKIQWSVVILFGCIIFGYEWLWQRRCFERTYGKKGWAPTLGVLMAILALLLVFGIFYLVDAIYETAVWWRNPFVLNRYLMGCFLTSPAFLVVMIGREKIYKLIARSLDKVRRKQDGAFLAVLLNHAEIEPGDVYYYERADGQPNELFAESDPRYRFKAAGVLDVTDFELLIADLGDNPSTKISQLSMKAIQILVAQETKNSIEEQLSTFMVSEEENESALTSSERAQKRWRRSFTAVRSLNALRRTGMGGDRIHPSLRSARWINRAGTGSLSRSKSTKDILEIGSTQFRCIEWSSMSLELLQKSSKVHINWFSLSRPVKKGEFIDFFISHSWLDDPTLKWHALQLLADEFTLEVGRQPTFWFDKACIDQQNIEDGLAMLPMNVMACERMLILCGENYPERIWCAWEICTILSFVSLEQALAQIVIVPLVDTIQDEKEECRKDERRGSFVEAYGTTSFAESLPIKKLLDFDVNVARCYDPNDERRLRAVIRTVGQHDFNKKVRSLASAAIKPQRKEPKKSASWENAYFA